MYLYLHLIMLIRKSSSVVPNVQMQEIIRLFFAIVYFTKMTRNCLRKRKLMHLNYIYLFQTVNVNLILEDQKQLVFSIAVGAVATANAFTRVRSIWLVFAKRLSYEENSTLQDRSKS